MMPFLFQIIGGRSVPWMAHVRTALRPTVTVETLTRCSSARLSCTTSVGRRKSEWKIVREEREIRWRDENETRATTEKGNEKKKSGRKNEESEGCGGTVAKPNSFLGIHLITAGPARINSCLGVKEIQHEARKKGKHRERETTCRRTQSAKYHSSHYRKFMVAETAAQFNSPLWQIENYSLVPPAGAINCNHRHWPA